ncbi:hypothetical protein LC613_28685 [Nostoc sphaeroides CHAB 2801]|nr:hypothetical protein [Nostoc sphaeroides]MCC5631697.1 hypothetical protein [Nostoc sphaeroides CHAB 2801]
MTLTRPTSITNTTASTSIDTGALTIDGGLGVAGAGYFGGNVTIGGNSVSNPTCFINGAAATQRYIRFLTAGISRWNMGVGTVAESGSNAGSQFYIQAFNDAGSAIDTPLTITRAAGGSVSITRPVDITNTTASNSISTGALTLDGGIGVAGAGFFGGALTTTQFRLSALNTAPASATATGTLGEIRYDANYMYVCTATNTWKRSALTTW